MGWYSTYFYYFRTSERLEAKELAFIAQFGDERTLITTEPTDFIPGVQVLHTLIAEYPYELRIRIKYGLYEALSAIFDDLKTRLGSKLQTLRSDFYPGSYEALPNPEVPIKGPRFDF